MCATGATANDNRIALVIANGNYPDVGAATPTPGKDADILAAELGRDGFVVSVLRDIDKSAIQQAIASFEATITPGTTALVYFNGLGLRAGHQTFLLPVNAQIWSDADVRRDGINLETLVGDLHRKGAKTQIVVIDAARRNPFERRFRPVSLGLSGIDVPEGTLAIFADALGKVGNDPDGGVSLFMDELLKELRIPGSSAEDAFIRTRIGVSRASHREQTPWVTSSLTETFVFKRTEPEAKSAAEVEPPVPAQPPNPVADADRAKQPTDEEPPASPPKPSTAERTVEPPQPSADRRPVAPADPCQATVSEQNGIVTLALADPARAGEATTFTLDDRTFGARFDQAGALLARAPMFHPTADLAWTGAGATPCRQSGLVFHGMGSLVVTALVWSGPYALALHVVEPPLGRLGGPVNYVYPGRPNADHSLGLGDMQSFGAPDDENTHVQLYTLEAGRNPHRGDIYDFVEFVSRGNPAREPYCGDAKDAVVRFKIVHLDGDKIEQKGGSFGSVACGTSWSDDRKDDGYYQRWKFKL